MYMLEHLTEQVIFVTVKKINADVYISASLCSIL